MKSERRHELERNQLLVWFSETSERIKPYINAILGAVLVVLVLILAASLWSRHSEGQSSVAWDSYFTALNGMDRTALENVAQKYPGTGAAYWALVTLGDIELDSGCNLLFVNKTSANLELRKAVEHYQAVLSQASSSALLERATYGLARARESQGDLEQALKAYGEIVAKWPKGTFGEVANERTVDLKAKSVRSFYDRFSKFDPKPALANEPGTPGKKPAFDLDSISDTPAAKTSPAKKDEAKKEGAKKDQGKTAEEKKQAAKPETKPTAKPAPGK
jgi:tetratricopeptide (TPR) repeat protein